MAVKITGGHSGPFNMRASFTLNGVHKGSANDLVELMRSSEPIDPQTREAIADALERKSGVRLEFHRGNEAPLTDHFETELKYQQIADSVAARMRAGGAVEKNAKADAAKEFGVSLRTVATALRRRRRARYRISNRAKV